MAFRSNISSQVRGFYFAASGSDSFSGQSLETPKLTMQAAIDAAATLDPLPSNVATANVTAAQGGSFNKGFTMVPFVSFEGTDVAIINSDPISITMASFVGCLLTTLVNFSSSATCVEIDGISLMGFTAGFLGTSGANGIGVNITGTVDDIFIEVSRLRVQGTDGIGIKVTSTNTTALDIDVNTVGLESQDSIFIDYNPVSGEAVVAVSAIIEDGVTGTIAFNAKSGRLIVESCGLIEADTAIHVFNGAIMDIFADTVSGDITVDVGGELNCIILNHLSGTITINGVINGIINGKRFGSYLPQVVLIAESFVNQNPTGLDTPLQVEFGAAQGTVSDPVMLSAAGVITINETGRYRASLFAQYGRAGAGSASWLFFRGLRNGIQEQVSVLAKLDNANSDLPMQFEVTRRLEAGDILVFQVIRDSQGFDSGGLISESPTPAGWLDSPSAHITLIKE